MFHVNFRRERWVHANSCDCSTPIFSAWMVTAASSQGEVTLDDQTQLRTLQKCLWLTLKSFEQIVFKGNFKRPPVAMQLQQPKSVFLADQDWLVGAGSLQLRRLQSFHGKAEPWCNSEF